MTNMHLMGISEGEKRGNLGRPIFKEFFTTEEKQFRKNNDPLARSIKLNSHQGPSL